MRRHRGKLFWALVGALISGVGFAAYAEEQASDKEQDDYYALMKVFVSTYEQIERNYVKDVDRRELMEAAIEGMIHKLDPYSSYIGPRDLSRFTQAVEQEFGGIGIQVSIDPKSNQLTVMTPLPGTPAYKAGVRAGDVIMSINGESTKDFKTQDAVERLKGKPGESVKITVKHLGKEETEDITIVRDVIQVATVRGDHYHEDGHWEFMADPEHKIGYIRLTNFSRRSADELRDALDALQAAGMKGLILDLRFNPGGLLSQATEISDMFIESGKIVSTKGKNTPEKEWTAKKDGTYSGFPMVVLVNRYSASASEIVSACLQDHERAEIVGERTWGKGSVQNVFQLEDGDSALKLTTASYHRPSGKNIHRFPDSKEEDEWGVMPKPDFLVKFSDEELEKYHDYRADRDILSAEGPPKSEFNDRQYAKALEYVVAQVASGATGAEKKDEAAAAPDKPAEPAPAVEEKKSDDQSSIFDAIDVELQLQLVDQSDARST